ncbi:MULTISPECIES: Gfo/Idh/MocA family protein [Alicyclobacillus]|uniref:Gfo/Idh/MocA family protein n=1 Tax=Alicyclobacillus TaxID=29330 RepID=UPI000B12C419|nr:MULTISPECIES: Gfo/Idh/MocA family oxidoreductase [Alicyclobacillus]
MAQRRVLRFGVIGAGLMGREFASAAMRWCHLDGLDFAPSIVAVCDVNERATRWFEDNVPTVERVTRDYHELLADPSVDAVYCALPHHLHARTYVDAIRAGKHLMGEKPFGIDEVANQQILAMCHENPEVLVRCSSEFPFFPGAYQIAKYVQEGRFGRLIEVEAGFWHSSDLNPDKEINWKRLVKTNGAYGCMGDLGLHVVHLPFRFGWRPRNVRAVLSNIVTERPDGHGGRVACDTWDNALLLCEAEAANGDRFPMTLSMKRIAPGHANTWFLRIIGTRFSVEYSTKNPKQLLTLRYQPGAAQSWEVTDVAHESAYPSITGPIFEFGFSDSILQMWAAFCDEVVNGVEMRQPMRCATPEETAQSHRLFTAALVSHATGETVSLLE